MLKNGTTVNITLSAFHLSKKFIYTLTLNDSYKQLFFIIQSGKASKCFFYFINRADECHPYFINKNANKYYLHTTIEKAMYQ